MPLDQLLLCYIDQLEFSIPGGAENYQSREIQKYFRDFAIFEQEIIFPEKKCENMRKSIYRLSKKTFFRFFPKIPVFSRENAGFSQQKDMGSRFFE